MRCPSSRALILFAGMSTVTSLLMLAGCSSREQASVMPISGKVLLDGEPLKFGTVTFQPPSGQPARGEIGADGKFVLSTYRSGDGAPVGRHKVKITCYTSQDPSVKKSAEGPQESLGESLIPERYTRLDTSDLEVAVLASGNKEFLLELKSDPPETESDEPPAEPATEPSAADPAAEPATEPSEPSATEPSVTEPSATESAPEDSGSDAVADGDRSTSTNQPPTESEPVTK